MKTNQKIVLQAENNFQTYYLNRKESQGGGLIIGVHKDVESALVREGDDIIEAMVIHVEIEGITIKIINAYGPQENADKNKKDKFWDFLEEETVKAELENCGLIIQMDGNMHAGPELLKNDPNLQNKNGKLLEEFLERNNGLILANNMDICEGIITRQRILEKKTEKAILELFIINEKMKPFLTKLTIDEDRKFCLSNFAQKKKNGRAVETDHNTMIADFSISVQKRKQNRVEMFNFRNKNCQKLFRKETNENVQLIECFENNSPFEAQSKQWMKAFNNILHRCFKKIRVVSNKMKENKAHKLIQKRMLLKKEVVSQDISIDMNMILKKLKKK